MNILFIQGGGAGAYAEDALLAARLQQALGAAHLVHYPALPDEDAPVYALWRRHILSEIAALGAEVLLVGHSFGASITLKVLVEDDISRSVRGVFLLAPPYWGEADWEVEEYALEEGFSSSLSQNPAQNPALFFYHSRDDVWVPFAHQARYAEAFPHAVVRTFADRGHQFGDDLSEVAADIRSLVG